MDTDNSVVVCRKEGEGSWEEGKRGENGDICNSVNKKIQLKKNIIKDMNT